MDIMKRMRTFIALKIPESQRRIIWNLILKEKKKNLPIKWVEFENLHITLKFLGEIDEKKSDEVISILNDIAQKSKPITLVLEGLGCFPGPRNPRVLWVGVGAGNKETIFLAEEIENSLAKYGFKREEKKFHPHLTIGRIKKLCRVDEILAQTIRTEPFVVDSLTLFKSTLKPEGPIYEVLQNFPFAGKV